MASNKQGSNDKAALNAELKYLVNEHASISDMIKKIDVQINKLKVEETIMVRVIGMSSCSIRIALNST